MKHAYEIRSTIFLPAVPNMSSNVQIGGQSLNMQAGTCPTCKVGFQTGKTTTIRLAT